MEDFCIDVCKVCSGFRVVSVQLSYQGSAGLIESKSNCCFLFSFWKSLRMSAVSPSLSVQWNSPRKPSGAGCFFVGRFLIPGSISLSFSLDLMQHFISVQFWATRKGHLPRHLLHGSAQCPISPSTSPVTRVAAVTALAQCPVSLCMSPVTRVGSVSCFTFHNTC